jgi:NAD(P)-dependent dehydrogenase (short-subunit alcohol dehydrogenase family)
MSFKGRVYIITGGGSGMGLATAKILVQQGARVGLVGRTAATLERAVEELGADKAMALAADVANLTAISDAFKAIKNRFGRLDGVVNNAGIARPNPIEELDEDEVQLQVQTNFVGTVFCCQAAIPLLRGSDNPRIVNVSSASAWHTDEMLQLSIYASTKAAVERFTRDLRVELQEDGIGVTCLRPGSADTGFAESWDFARLKRSVDKWHDLGPKMDVGMTAEHVAESIVHVLGYPSGVAVDLLEIRPNQAVEKIKF